MYANKSKCQYYNRLVMVLYIKLGLEVEQEVLRKGKPNKLGFGSYKADNTETIRPYQQEASSPIGRGYPMSVVSGAPTVYDPRAGIKEDPVVVLLKKLLGMKPIVEKAPDAGFRNNVQVDVGSDRGIGGGGGGNVVVGRTLGEDPRERIYPAINVTQEITDLEQISNEQQVSMINQIATGIATTYELMGAAARTGQAMVMFAKRAAGGVVEYIPSTVFYDALVRQVFAERRAEQIIGLYRQAYDMIEQVTREVSDDVIRPVQGGLNYMGGVLRSNALSNGVVEYPAFQPLDPYTRGETVMFRGVPLELIMDARHTYQTTGSLPERTIQSIVDSIIAGAGTMAADYTVRNIAIGLLTFTFNARVQQQAAQYGRAIPGLRDIPRVNYQGM